MTNWREQLNSADQYTVDAIRPIVASGRGAPLERLVARLAELLDAADERAGQIDAQLDQIEPAVERIAERAETMAWAANAATRHPLEQLAEGMRVRIIRGPYAGKTGEIVSASTAASSWVRFDGAAAGEEIVFPHDDLAPLPTTPALEQLVAAPDDPHCTQRAADVCAALIRALKPSAGLTTPEDAARAAERAMAIAERFREFFGGKGATE